MSKKTKYTKEQKALDIACLLLKGFTLKFEWGLDAQPFNLSKIKP